VYKRQGNSINVKVSDKGAFINSSKLVATDVDASNGVIHIIDAVLMPPAKGANARQVIREAIAEGAQLFNSGHHTACATLYHNTMNELMSTDLDASVKQQMKTVLTSARHETCSTTRAWTLRHGMDQMYVQLGR